MSEVCGSPSFGTANNIEQWYECDLELGHGDTYITQDLNGNDVTLFYPSEHNYIAIDHIPDKADRRGES